ncbi:CPBP family intramembrane glutamic endopeptidase [Chryseobacterium sp. JK1]|uniref:CPBP family intramembrane glutamic endopeptidase n=1 Tax=Chryseobacterium sp. JK1 TaxID=874294 RepID=UPI003D695932
MHKNVRFFTIFILGFITYYLFDLFCFKSIQTFVRESLHSKALAHVAAYSVTMIPLIITLKILFPKKEIVVLFSLDQSIIKGLTISFIGTLPMLIGYSIFSNLAEKFDFESLFINTLSSAFFEELIFRAFLIGILLRYTKLGFISSLLFASLLFAQAHLYQSHNIKEALEILTITFLGSVLFAWVYTEWNFTIWVSIFLHFFMNLYWNIFDISDNAAGNTLGNIFRFSSVILIILMTIYYKKRKNIPFRVTWKSLFIKSGEVQS